MNCTVSLMNISTEYLYCVIYEREKVICGLVTMVGSAEYFLRIFLLNISIEYFNCIFLPNIYGEYFT